MTKYVFVKRTMHIFKREDEYDEEVINQLDSRYIKEGRVKPVDVEKPVESEPEPELSEKVQEKFEDVKADLKDDGKLNHSNNPKKKSPGRPKKKSNKKK